MKHIKLITLLSTTALIGTLPITSCSKQPEVPEVVQHTITFSCSDGITLSGETTIKVNDKTKWKDVTKPTVSSSIEGYQIIGWYNSWTEITDETEITTDLSAKCVGYDPKSTLNEITVVTAKKEYPNNTYIQGGTWGGFKQYYEVTEPEKEGSIFEGWYIGDTKIDDDYIFPTGQLKLTVTAHFVKNKRVITFDRTDGVTFDPETPAPINVEDGTTWGNVEKPTVTVDTENYIDLGWYYKSGTGYVELDDSTPITKDITAKYYALAKSELIIDVSLEIDGKTQTNKYYKNGSWADFKTYYQIETPVKTGYTFIGWYVDGNKIDEETYKFPIQDKITIKAQFSINSYTVTFATDGGATFDQKPDPIQVVYQTKWSAIEKPKVTLKPDYIEDGWYDSDGGKMTDDTPITGKLQAVYRTIDITSSKVNVTVKIDGTSYGPLTFLQGKTWKEFKELYEIEDPSKEGYHFDGWRCGGAKISDSWVFPVHIKNITIEGKLFISFAADSWENICKYANEGGISKLHEVYKIDCEKNTDFEGTLIGLQKDLEINGKIHKVRVVDEEHDDLADGSGKASLTFELVTLLSDANGNQMKSFWDSNISTCVDYTNSTLRWNLTGAGSGSKPTKNLWDKPAINMLPDVLLNNIKTVTKQVATTASYTVIDYNDKIFPITCVEMAQSATEYPNEGTVYKYWNKHNTNEDRIKKEVNGNIVKYWLATPCNSSIYYAQDVNVRGRVERTNVWQFNLAVNFGFCI